MKIFQGHKTAIYLQGYLNALTLKERKILEVSEPIQHLLRDAPLTPPPSSHSSASSVVSPPQSSASSPRRKGRLPMRKPFGMHSHTSQTPSVCTPLVASLALNVFPAHIIRSLEPVAPPISPDMRPAEELAETLRDRWEHGRPRAVLNEFLGVINEVKCYSSARVYDEIINVRSWDISRIQFSF